MDLLQWTIFGVIVVPLAAALGAFVVPRIAVPLAGSAAFLELVSALGLAGRMVRSERWRYEIGGWGAPLGIDWHVDGLAALMLLMTALVGCAVTIYATAYFDTTAHDPAQRHDVTFFWPLHLFLWATLNAVFLSGDIFNVYVTLELLTVSAVALVGLAGSVDALAAALRYLLMAVAASLFYLLGVALLYSAYGTLDWELLGQRFLLDQPSRCAIALIIVGLLLKTALFPLHVWLPAAHASAPAPASALLSALVLKASFLVMLRLWFQVVPYADLPGVGQWLGILGAAAILWGSVQAIRQPRLKLMVAYSTVAQIGYLFLVFALTAEPSGPWKAWSATSYFALSHACAKGAAFLAAGSLQYASGSDRISALRGTAEKHPVTVFAFALAGVGLAGLPPSGGFVAKWLLLESALGSRSWGLAVVILLGGLLAAAYVSRVVAVSLLSGKSRVLRRVPLRMQFAPLGLALAAMALGAAGADVLELLEVGAPFPVPPGGDLSGPMEARP